MEKFKKTFQEIIDKEPLKDFGLKLIGIGSEKIVFETPGSTKKIIKVNTGYLKKKNQSFIG